MIHEISPLELNSKLKQKDDFILLDVRTFTEVMMSKIEGSIHIPMNELTERLNELNKNKEIIVQCKLGKRSAKVCEFLMNNNFKNVKNLAGGILAWSREIDPSVIVL